MITAALEQALQRAARCTGLLVAADYDGTLAPIVDDPARAFPHQPAVRGMIELAALPAVHSVIVSGRSLEALQRLTGTPAGVVLIGSHGAEHPNDEPAPRRGVAELAAALQQVVDRFPGSTLESKPMGAAFHYRHVREPQQAAQAARQVAEGHAARLIEGKMVIEALMVDIDKGTALQRLGAAWNSAATVFFGDDATDEDVFAVLGTGDVPVKVGPGSSLARHRVADPAEVATALAMLAALRREIS